MTGIIHVGAHRGEEVPGYLVANHSPILLFEPQTLTQTWQPNLAVVQVSVALSDHNGDLTLRIPHHLHATTDLDTMSASGLILHKENAVRNGWTPTECELVTVPVRRFDTWAAQSGYVRGSCTLLVVDVQGMELQVLRGFGTYLNEIEEIQVECSEPPLYEGGASANQVVGFLQSCGFSALTPVIRHGDVSFRRNSL